MIKGRRFHGQEVRELEAILIEIDNDPYLHEQDHRPEAPVEIAMIRTASRIRLPLKIHVGWITPSKVMAPVFHETMNRKAQRMEMAQCPPRVRLLVFLRRRNEQIMSKPVRMVT